MGAWKKTKELNEKKTLVLYNISKDQSSKLDSPKNKRATLGKSTKLKDKFQL